MKRLLLRRFPAGLLWLATALLLVLARFVDPWAGVLALGLMLAQVIGRYIREDSWDSLALQVRTVFAAFIFTGHLPNLGPLLWLPALAAAVVALADYCILSRLLSLMAPHRTSPLDRALLRRTFSAAWRPAPSTASPRLRLSTAAPFP